MKVLKWVGVLVAVYVGFVVAFETLFLGLYQPKLERSGIPMLVITTTDDSVTSSPPQAKCSAYLPTRSSKHLASTG